VSEILTPSQTVGPFFHIGLEHIAVSDLTAGTAEQPIEITGRVLDGDGQPVIDALVELWQANAQGRYAHAEEASFKGHGRIATDANGSFRFTTIKPGRVSGPDGLSQAPHIAVNVFMRGLLKHLVTRIYFPGESSNDDDAVLQRVPQNRRPTLIAKPVAGNHALLTWDIVLQGENETVFFDC
jgi:protocatechuate 3,4-dioxygenase, alpha subunit